MTAYADIQITVPAETKVSLSNRCMVAISHDGARVLLSDTWDKPEAVADLIARMFETLATAPDLTDEERTAVRERMSRAMQSTYWQRVEDEAKSIEDRVICFSRVPGGFCVLDKGHDEGCANVRTVVGA